MVFVLFANNNIDTINNKQTPGDPTDKRISMVVVIRIFPKLISPLSQTTSTIHLINDVSIPSSPVEVPIIIYAFSFLLLFCVLLQASYLYDWRTCIKVNNNFILDINQRLPDAQ